jgi:hypothetical protein
LGAEDGVGVCQILLTIAFERVEIISTRRDDQRQSVRS